MDLQLFENEQFGLVRTLVIDGAVWFVGKDVAAALGYADTVNALKTHVDPEDKKIVDLNEVANHHPITDATSGGWLKNTVTIINESGMYALIFGSKLPKAKEFKHWVTSEVLPSIRSKGYYFNDKVADARAQSALMNQALDDIENFARRFQAIFGISKPIALANAITQIEAAYPIDANFFKKMLPPSNPDVARYNATDVARYIGVRTAKEANIELCKAGLQQKNEAGQWILTELGSHYGEVFPYFRHGHAGYQIRWRDSVFNVLVAD